MPVSTRGQVVTDRHERRSHSVRIIRELRTKFCNLGIARYADVSADVIGPADEVGIQLVFDGVDSPAGRQVRLGLRWLVAAQRHNAIRPVVRYLPRVNFEQQVAIDDETRPGRGSQREIRRIGTSNACYYPVGLAQVKAGIHTQRHDGRRRIRYAAAGADAQHPILTHTQLVFTSRKRDRLRQRPAFGPELKLARGIAFDLAMFKHRNHNDFDRNRFSLGYHAKIEQQRCNHQTEHYSPSRQQGW